MLGLPVAQRMTSTAARLSKDAARIFNNVMTNTATPAQKNCVIANSAFAIQVICPEKKIETCIAEARESLESGSALATLKKFISLNN